MHNFLINVFFVGWIVILVGYVYYNFAFYLTRRKKNGGGGPRSRGRPATINK